MVQEGLLEPTESKDAYKVCNVRVTMLCIELTAKALHRIISYTLIYLQHVLGAVHYVLLLLCRTACR